MDTMNVNGIVLLLVSTI